MSMFGDQRGKGKKKRDKDRTEEEYEIEGGKRPFHSKGFGKCVECGHPRTLHAFLVGFCVAKDCDCNKYIDED